MTFTEEQLKNKDFLKEQEDRYNKMEMHDEFLEAYRLSKGLEDSIEGIPDFKNRYYDVYVEYKKIIIKLKWLGLPVMTSEKVISMFQHHFIEIFDIFDYDLWRKFEASLLGFLYLEERDDVKLNVVKALEKNGQKITNNKITVGKESQRPTVSNWIKDYSTNLGVDKIDDIKRIEYLTNGTNIKKLSPEEVERIKALFGFYEKLKISSQTMEGFEETIPMTQAGRPGSLYRGVFTPYPSSVVKNIEKEVKPVEEVQKIEEVKQEQKSEDVEEDEIDVLMRDLSKYPVDSLEFKALQEEIKNLEKKNK